MYTYSIYTNMLYINYAKLRSTTTIYIFLKYGSLSVLPLFKIFLKFVLQTARTHLLVLVASYFRY